MKSLAHSLLVKLSDGQFHSGTALGKEVGCSRTAIWKALQNMQENGISIYSVRGKGYRLVEPVELLNQERIRAALSGIMSEGEAQRVVQQLDIFHDIESTNTYLLNLSKGDGQSGHACLAEQQHAGRGRRGRRWVSPFGGNLYLSLLWEFNAGAAQLGGLSLAIAVAVMRTLRSIGISDAGVKWPNDILLEGKKLAGILIELSGETAGPCAVVIGIGLNVRASKSEMAEVEQPWTDLESALGQSVSRNSLVAHLLFQLISAVREFEAQGLKPFLKEWSEYDIFSDQEVVLSLPQGNVRGIARGIDASGALVLVTEDGVQRFHSGEVSMRASISEGYA